jgi:hypothetical protein
MEFSPPTSSSSALSSTSSLYCWEGETPTTAYRLSCEPSTFSHAVDPKALYSRLNTEVYYRSASRTPNRIFKWHSFDARPPGVSLPAFYPGYNSTPVNSHTRRKIATAFSYPVSFGQVKYQLKCAIEDKEEREDKEEDEDLEEGEVLEKPQFAFPRTPPEEYIYPARDAESSPTPHGLWSARDGQYCLSPAKPCTNCRYSWPVNMEALDEKLKRLAKSRRRREMKANKKKGIGGQRARVTGREDVEGKGGERRLTSGKRERTREEEQDGGNLEKSEDKEGKGRGEVVMKSKCRRREEEPARECVKKTKRINQGRERRQEKKGGMSEERLRKNEERAERRTNRETRHRNEDLAQRSVHNKHLLAAEQPYIFRTRFHKSARAALHKQMP